MTYSIYICEFQKDKLSEKNETLNWEGEYIVMRYLNPENLVSGSKKTHFWDNTWPMLATSNIKWQGFIFFKHSDFFYPSHTLFFATPEMTFPYEVFLLQNLTIYYTRSYAALRAADLDWIIGPGYSSGGYILGENHEKPTWNHEKPGITEKRHWRGATTDLLDV